MTKDKTQELINKLSMLGYYAKEEEKDSIFLAIAATYSLNENNFNLLEKYVDQVIKKETLWDKNIVYQITNV